MLEPNCTIVLSYFASQIARRRRRDGIGRTGANDPAGAEFSYHISSASVGWAVSEDGTILPPSRSRIVTIRLGYPAGAQITGFQLAADTARLPPESVDPWFLEPAAGVTILRPDPFPPKPGAKVTEVTLDLGGSGQLLFYRLAVDGDWDDPKIYNDPIE